MKKLITSIALAASVLSMSAQFSNGSFLLSESGYPDSGDLYWFSNETGSFGQEKCYYNANGIGFGATSQFGTIYGGKLFVTSKQAGNGGLLAIADASSMRLMRSFSEFLVDGHNYDGRQFVGITENKGYFGTSNGIYAIEFDTMSWKFIDGTDCGYGAGETIDGGWYQYDTYYHQIGSMVRVGDYVFASQQNRGILVIDVENDQLVTMISAEQYGGSFTDLVQAKDGSLWTSPCGTENYSYDQTPELPGLIRIDPETLEVSYIELEYSAVAPWSTWRPGMMAACSLSNRILWKEAQFKEDDWGMGYYQTVCTRICYYDIDTQTAGVLADVTSYGYTAVYASINIDPETDYIYVPCATNGTCYGPWKLLVFNADGSLVLNSDTPLQSQYSDYASMMIITDDYAPAIYLSNGDNSYEEIGESGCEKSMDKGEVATLVASDFDNYDVAIVVDAFSSDESVAAVSVKGPTVTIEKVAEGNAYVEIKALSNGIVTTRNIEVKNGASSSLDAVVAAKCSIVYDSVRRGIKIDVVNEGTLYVYDLAGKVVMTEGVNAGESFVSTSELKAGVYVVKLGDSVVKFVK